MEIPSQNIEYTPETVQELANDLIPIPTSTNHKGQMGRVCVIGGSLQYAGAAYYASISSLKSGADLVYLICCEDSVQTLKSYSPELMILPYYLDQNKPIDILVPWLSRMHSVLIGPGLGTDTIVQQTVVKIIDQIVSMKLEIPIVIDADGLKLLKNNINILNHYNGSIYLTPNKMEFKTLFPNNTFNHKDLLNIGKHVTLITKGEEDKIRHDTLVVNCKEPNSWRRCGGQGDLLSGTLATLSHYANIKKNDRNIKWEVIASYAACSIVRKSNLLAYNINRRSTMVTDMITQFNLALQSYFRNW